MRTSTRRCYVHVGSPKTGTSYIQSAFWASTDALADQGLKLPLRPTDHFRLTLALRELLDESMDPPAAFTVVDRLGKALARSSADRTLITHELLAPVTAERARLLHDLLSDFEVHVVITARDLARQIPAEWQQGIKHRSTRTYDTFLEAVVGRGAPHFWAVQDAADIAARWRGSLPAQRVHIVTVPQPTAPRDTLLKRFCSVLDVDPSSLATDAAKVNPSMGAQQAELLRRVNVALGNRLPHPRAGYGRVAKDHLGNRVLAAQDGIPLRLPRRLEGWAREASLDIVARIRAAGYAVIGDLDELVPRISPPGAASDDDAAQVDEAAVSAAAVDAIAALLDQRHRDLEQLRAARTGLREQQGPGGEQDADADRPGAGSPVRRAGSALRGLKERTTPPR